MADLHPTLSGAEKARLLDLGVALFNRGEFFAAHEAWEEIWRSSRPDPRDLFQGLIQLAAGMHHHQVSRRPGAAGRLLARGRRRLEPFAPGELGLDLTALLTEIALWEEWLEGSVSGAAPGSPPPLPKISFLPG